MEKVNIRLLFVVVVLGILLIGCSGISSLFQVIICFLFIMDVNDYKYLIGLGDNVLIFVWCNFEILGSFVVCFDGKVIIVLVEDLDVLGCIFIMLVREIEEKLLIYINNF